MITFQEAAKVFFKNLREDEDLYRAYEANIAMSFYDEFRRSGLDAPPDLHKICNVAADNFLKLLLSEVNKSQEQNIEDQLIDFYKEVVEKCDLLSADAIKDVDKIMGLRQDIYILSDISRISYDALGDKL